MLLTDPAVAPRGGAARLRAWAAAGWEVAPVRTGAASARRAAKALKFGAHALLPREARYALYVDATVRQVSDYSRSEGRPPTASISGRKLRRDEPGGSF